MAWRDLLRSLAAPFAWRVVKDTGAWRYCQNSITGQRRASWIGDGYQPVDMTFIRPGDIIEGMRGAEIVQDGGANDA